ncbi:MAG: cysteine desulfurase [Gammaproteobacteria bacterium]|nr:cysteine desulfurase [Gammaproteobacteria bacterium]MCP4091151.1 cysteine desulfurase [Gammaproteobacteria bacterium]MCP4277323.1 cysteine desulfurase [Gammaproteobacteria bacterium]MCP4831616.1 cysteine desulfurase [Gammaproteobacteria bacterium]MCP4927839.1 cysteine desulfurase [Gammaproteobacteria bacterium]
MDINRIRADFPILNQEIHGCRLAFLDNAASAQRPTAVIDAVSRYYQHDHANVHRGVHTLSHRATDAYEGAREKIRGFINATSISEIVFTSGTTEAINLIASSLGQSISADDEILISHMEHHSNIVPWQMLCERTGAVLRVAPINEDGELLVDEMISLMSDRTRLVALTHISNALGTINPIEIIITAAHERNIPVLIDGAQAVPHTNIDVQKLGCEFYVFSGHKMCGPTGIGILYGREDWLERLPPWQGGGEMILSVNFEEAVYNRLPYKFEAGTPNIAGAIGLGAAIDYLQAIGMDNIAAYEATLLDYLTDQLSNVSDLQLIGTAKRKAGVQSFVIKDIHPHDLGTVLDHKGIAIRTGHHCAMPVMDFFEVPGTARASLAFYNTHEDVDQLIEGLAVAKDIFT